MTCYLAVLGRNWHNFVQGGIGGLFAVMLYPFDLGFDLKAKARVFSLIMQAYLKVELPDFSSFACLQIQSTSR